MTAVNVNTAADLNLNSKSSVTPLVVTNQPISSQIPYRDHLANERTLLAWMRQAFGTWIAVTTMYFELYFVCWTWLARWAHTTPL